MISLCCRIFLVVSMVSCADCEDEMRAAFMLCVVYSCIYGVQTVGDE